MDDIKIETKKLLEIMKTNKETHEKIYNEAVEGYKESLGKRLDALKEKVSKGEWQDIHIGLSQPSNHLKDYNQIIGMLELTSQPEMELTYSEFSNYVMDDWAWKQQFISGSNLYTNNKY